MKIIKIFRLIAILLLSMVIYGGSSLAAEDSFMAGVNVNGQWYNSYGPPPSDAENIADWIVSINANWASVQATLWQKSLSSDSIEQEVLDGNQTGCNVTSPTQNSIEDYIRRLHNKGLKVQLKIVIKAYGNCGYNPTLWHGLIDPTNPSAWFQSYKSKLIEYARIAERNNVEMLAFGNELATISKQYYSEWQRVISELRNVYNGKLIYCATFPNESYYDDAEYNKVVFWDLIDYIGINLWPTAANGELTPSVEQIKDSYNLFRQKLDNWNASRGFNKKIIITEFGVPNRNKCVEKPEHTTYDNTIPNMECQNNGYAAFFDVFNDDQNVTGIFVHEDLVGHPPAGIDYYQIRGRSAEHTVTKWFNLITNPVIPPSVDSAPISSWLLLLLE